MAKNKNSKKSSDISGLVFVGFIIVGVALGFLLGNLVAFTLFGLGAGFIAKAIIDALYRK